MMRLVGKTCAGFSLLVGLLLPFAVMGQTGAEVSTESDFVPIGGFPGAATLTFDRIVDAVADRRVILIGERHDRYDHHLTQLAVIERLHARGEALSIGLEMFQRPAQAALDDFIAGEIDEIEMLRRTDYFDRWGFDYRLYRPILTFAREHTIPLVALNLPKELIQSASEHGIDDLGEAEKAQLPPLRGDISASYRARLLSAFEAHAGKSDFERFLLIQRLWDSGMARTAADYLALNRDRRLVILAGAGHVGRDGGIAVELAHAGIDDVTTMAFLDAGLDTPQAVNWWLWSNPAALPANGRLGIRLESTTDGVVIKAIDEDGAMEGVDVQVGDYLRQIDGVSIQAVSDVRLALWQAEPGQEVTVTLARRSVDDHDNVLTYRVRLE